MIDQAEAWKIVEAHGSSSGSSGGAARSGARQEKKQSAKGLTCHMCGDVGHIQRNCPKGRNRGSAQSADGDFFFVRGGRQGERGRGKGRGRGSHGRGGRGGNQAAAGGGASACLLYTSPSPRD